MRLLPRSHSDRRRVGAENSSEHAEQAFHVTCDRIHRDAARDEIARAPTKQSLAKAANMAKRFDH